MSKPNTIKIDDIEYVRSDVAKPIVGNRYGNGYGTVNSNTRKRIT
jgi:hypothetical protein